MNTAVSKYAPKGRIYCTTMSLTHRVMIAMEGLNSSFQGFWAQVFNLLRMFLSPSLDNHLKMKDNKRNKKWKYETTVERKIKRAKSRNEKMKEEIKNKLKTMREEQCTELE